MRSGGGRCAGMAPVAVRVRGGTDLRVPTKLGFKNPKYIVEMTVTKKYPGGFWEKYGYNWISGL